MSLAQGISAGEFDLTYGEIPGFLLALLLADPDYQSATLQNGGMGLLFAALGVFALLRRTGKAVKASAITTLK